MCSRRMFVGKFTVLVRRSCMMLCILTLAHRVMVLSLMDDGPRRDDEPRLSDDAPACFGACAILTFLRFL